MKNMCTTESTDNNSDTITRHHISGTISELYRNSVINSCAITLTIINPINTNYDRRQQLNSSSTLLTHFVPCFLFKDFSIFVIKISRTEICAQKRHLGINITLI